MCRRRPLPRSGKPWDIDTPIDMAFPCATQYEVLLAVAKTLASHGCKYVLEGANMPCTPEAAHHFIKNGIIYVCGKAANAGEAQSCLVNTAAEPSRRQQPGSPGGPHGLGRPQTAANPAVQAAWP